MGLNFSLVSSKFLAVRNITLYSVCMHTWKLKRKWQKNRETKYNLHRNLVLGSFFLLLIMIKCTCALLCQKFLINFCYRHAHCGHFHQIFSRNYKLILELYVSRNIVFPHICKTCQYIFFSGPFIQRYIVHKAKGHSTKMFEYY